MTQASPSHDVVLTAAIGIVDPAARHAVREALAALDIIVTAEAHDVETLVPAVVANVPLVALVGTQIGGGGMQALHRLSREAPACQVVLLAADPNDDAMLEAVSAGAMGYLPRDLPVERIAAAMLAVLNGEVAISRAMMARVVDELQGRPGRRVATHNAPAAKLTSREWDVASLMRSGASTQQIAMRLFMSNSTVRVHVSNILHKLHVADRDAAVRVLAGI